MSDWIQYQDFVLPPTLADGLKDLGYHTPTSVQKEVFGPIYEGKDIVVQSHTGSGKTAAFCMPILARLKIEERLPQAIVLAPTRELAKQVAAECSRLGYHHGVKVSAIYGGASMEAQMAGLRAGCHVVVGTPGRVKDLIDRKVLKVGSIRVAVLDEADEMLSMGFWEDVTWLLQQMPKEKQTLFFSATIPPRLESSCAALLNDPVYINLNAGQQHTPTIRHIVHHEDEQKPKVRNLLYALEFHLPQRAIVFCNRKEETELVESYLRRFGYHARALHGDLSQRERERALESLKDGSIDIIIATDVAARGIDISMLSHVFNYQLPENNEVYVHRTGRTGRIGNLGTAVNLVRGNDARQTEALAEQFGIKFDEITLPSEKELMWMQGERLAGQLTEEADGIEFSQYRPVAEAMFDRSDMKELLAYLLRTHLAKLAPRAGNAPVEAEKPKAPERPRERAREPEQEKKPRTVREAMENTEPGERPERIERTERIDLAAPSNEPRIPRTPSTNMYVTLGRVDGFYDILALADHLSQLSGVDMGHFTGLGNIRDQSSHIEVDTEVVSQIVDRVHNQERAKKRVDSATIVCEVAAPVSRPNFTSPRGSRPRHRR